MSKKFNFQAEVIQALEALHATPHGEFGGAKVFKLDTLYGPLSVHPYPDWIACCFDDAKRVTDKGLKVNPFSGKWNFHPGTPNQNWVTHFVHQLERVGAKSFADWTRVKWLDSEAEIRALGEAIIHSVGDENVYVEKDGAAYFFKPGNTNKFSVGACDFSAYEYGFGMCAVFLNFENQNRWQPSGRWVGCARDQQHGEEIALARVDKRVVEDLCSTMVAM